MSQLPDWTTTAGRVHASARRRFPADHVATVVHGSAALGDWVPAASDLDLLVLCRTGVDRGALDRFAEDVVAQPEPSPTPAAGTRTC